MPNPRSKRNVDWGRVVNFALRSIVVSPFLLDSLFYDLLKDLRESRDQLGERVSRAADSLHLAAQLVKTLEVELDQKLSQVQTLKSEYERYQQLANIEEEKAKALIGQLEQVFGANRNRERWIALAINLLAGVIVFVLGVLLSPWIHTSLGMRQPAAQGPAHPVFGELTARR